MREDIPTPFPAGPVTFSATPIGSIFTPQTVKPATAPPTGHHGSPTTAPPKTQKGHSKPANPWYHWVSLICIVQYTSAAEVLLPPFARPTSRIAPTSRRSCSPAPRLPPNCHIALVYCPKVWIYCPKARIYCPLFRTLLAFFHAPHPCTTTVLPSLPRRSNCSLLFNSPGNLVVPTPTVSPP